MSSGEFTSTDLETLKTAIMDLASGNAQLVQISGRMYRKSNLDELQRHYDWMLGRVTQVSGRGVKRMTFKAPSNQDDG